MGRHLGFIEEILPRQPGQLRRFNSKLDPQIARRALAPCIHVLNGRRVDENTAKYLTAEIPQDPLAPRSQAVTVLVNTENGALQVQAQLRKGARLVREPELHLTFWSFTSRRFDDLAVILLLASAVRGDLQFEVLILDNAHLSLVRLDLLHMKNPSPDRPRNEMRPLDPDRFQNYLAVRQTGQSDAHRSQTGCKSPRGRADPDP